MAASMQRWLLPLLVTAAIVAGGAALAATDGGTSDDGTSDPTTTTTSTSAPSLEDPVDEAPDEEAPDDEAPDDGGEGGGSDAATERYWGEECGEPVGKNHGEYVTNAAKDGESRREAAHSPCGMPLAAVDDHDGDPTPPEPAGPPADAGPPESMSTSSGGPPASHPGGGNGGGPPEGKGGGPRG